MAHDNRQKGAAQAEQVLAWDDSLELDLTREYREELRQVNEDVLGLQELQNELADTVAEQGRGGAALVTQCALQCVPKTKLLLWLMPTPKRRRKSYIW